MLRPVSLAMSEKRLASRFSVQVALLVVRGYQLMLRPMLSGQCRYLPTCSAYAAEAIATHGVLRGGWMGLTRVMRCHPFGGSGLDPVPFDSRRSLGAASQQTK